MHKKKITKRQRKVMTRFNEAVMYSRKNGAMRYVGEIEYVGTNPEYASKINSDTFVQEFVKVAPGVPFVRLTNKRAYVYGA